MAIGQNGKTPTRRNIFGSYLQKQDPKMFHRFGVLPFHQFDILPNDIFPICGWSKVCQGVEEIIIIRRN
jgi:hypothetical protein